MQFESLTGFIDMGGYGLFVWSVYGLGIAVLLYNVVMPKLLLRRFLGEQSRLSEVEKTRLNSEKKEAG